MSSGSQALAATILNAAVVRNSDVYGPAELFDVYGSYLGQPVTDATAGAIAKALQDRYIEDGYSRPGYRISDTGLSTGIVRIDVVEARISKVEFGGDAGPFRKRVERTVGALASGQPLQPAVVGETLRDVRGLAGLDIDVTTRSDEAHVGGIVLEVESAFRPVESTIKLSNRGTREIGRELMFGRLVGNGLFGFDNSGGLFVSTAQDRSNYHGVGLFSRGTMSRRGDSWRLLGSVTSLQFDSNGVLLQQDRERFVAGVTMPMLDESTRQSSFVAALDIDNLDIRQDDAASREDRLRSIEMGVRTIRRGNDWQERFSLEFEKGISAFGGGLENFLDPDDPRENDFVIVRVHYLRLLRLGDAWTFRWDVLAQESPQILPSVKRFKVGGNRIGRGFEAAAVSGDRGIGTKLELKRRLARGSGWLEALDTYAYYDIGAAWRNFGSTGRESAASAGLGITARSGRFSGYVEIAKPLTHADADGNRDATLFAEVSVDF